MPESVPLASHITRRAFEVNGMDDQYFGPKQPRPADSKKRDTGGISQIPRPLVATGRTS